MSLHFLRGFVIERWPLIPLYLATNPKLKSVVPLHNPLAYCQSPNHLKKSLWVYLYRAVDSTGATIDFLLSAKRDAEAAGRFLTKALGGENHPAPRVINTDKDAAYPPAIVRLKAEGALEETCRHRPVQYLNNILEQDHRAIKRRVRASQHFRSFRGAWRTISGYEAINMIRKGQACWSAAGVTVGLLHHFILGLFAAT
jgi:transposase, IS6 family